MNRDIKRLQRQWLDKLTILNIPIPCDTITLCEHLSRHRRREIHLVPTALRMSRSCGVWMATSTEDLIFYEAETSKVHQEHIIAHELAHIICGHKNYGHVSDGDALHLFPDLDPALVRGMLCRTTNADAAEQEAETIAYLIRATIAGRVILPPSEMLGALEVAMGYRYSL